MDNRQVKQDKLPIIKSNNEFLLENVSEFDEEYIKGIIGKHILYNLYENDCHTEFSTHIGKVLDCNNFNIVIYDLYETLSEEQRKSLEESSINYIIQVPINNIKDISVFDDYVLKDDNFFSELNNYSENICELTNIYDNKIIVYFKNNKEYCDQISIMFEYKDENQNINTCKYPTCLIKNINKI